MPRPLLKAKSIRRFSALLLAMLCVALLGCEQQNPPRSQLLRVAVAANFAPTLNELVAAYNEEQERPLEVQTMVASTGLLTAQIISGAPYDLLFAADAERPAAIVQAAKAIGQAQTYAYGRLALWGPDHDYEEARDRLIEGEYKKLVIANPDLAPYGAATQQVLQKMGLWAQVQGRLVRGENVGQAYRYVVTERVDLGFVALSQVVGQKAAAREEALWIVPTTMHSPIEQQAVLLDGPQPEAAEAFLDFCLGPAGREVIEQAGYDLPRVD